MKNQGNNHITLKNRIIYEDETLLEGLYERLYNKRATILRQTRKIIPLEDLLKEGCTYNQGALKRRLIKEEILVEKCDLCGLLPIWNNQKLVLQLDHKNGIKTDCRLENLRLLCPNCHSQTKTFAGKNGKRKQYKPKLLCKECGGEISSGSTSGLCKKCYRTSTRKVERPSKEVLLKQIDKHGYEATGRTYGVSGNAIRKWLKNY